MNQIPPVTKNLLIINILAFIATLTFQRIGVDLNNLLGLHFFMASDFRIYQLITYMFMHGGFTHIFFNMFAVWMFGRILERVWGSRNFLIFYLVCGIGAGLTQEIVQYGEYMLTLREYTSVNLGYAVVPMAEYLNMMNTVGASGAVYGILLGFGMTFPNEKIFIFPLPMPIKAKYFVAIYALIEIFSGIYNASADNVAHFAHLGGMLFGLLLIIYWRKKSRRNGYYD